jgi:hypothetical protein
MVIHVYRCSIVVVTEPGAHNHAHAVQMTDPFCHSAPQRVQEWAAYRGRPHWLDSRGQAK